MLNGQKEVSYTQVNTMVEEMHLLAACVFKKAIGCV